MTEPATSSNVARSSDPDRPLAPRPPLRLAAALGASAVAFGAFGAHGLRDHLLAHDSVATWETAAHYHLAHAVAMLGCSALAAAGCQVRLATWLLTAGTVVFSGTLYLLCLTAQKWLGAITPIGGTLLIAGWISLAWSAKSRDAVRCNGTESE